MVKDFATREWQYSTDASALSNMASIQIILWRTGMCIFGHTSDAVVNIAYSYSFHKPLSLIQLENLLLSLPILAGPQPVRNIWLIEPRNLSFPAEINDSQAATDWLRQLHFVEADETVHIDVLESIRAGIAYPVKTEIKNMLGQYFEEAVIRLLTAAPFFDRNKQSTPIAQLILAGKSYVSGVMHEGKMLRLQTGIYETLEDLAYHLAAVATAHNLPGHQMKVALQGIDADLAGLSRGMQDYYPKTVLIMDNDKAYANFLTRLS